MKNFLLIILIMLAAVSGRLLPQERDEYGNPILKKLTEEDAKRIFGEKFSPKLFKVAGDSRSIKEVIISGNKITTIVFNYGSICAPNRLGNIADMVWQGLGYGFEFGPLAAAEVTDDSGKVIHIVDDSFVRDFQGDYSTDKTIKWGWLPKAGYVDPDQNEIARLNSPDTDGDGKPDSWPERWYNPGAEKYIWPAFLGDQATAPDEEVYYVVDDYSNAEFNYYPFLADRTKRGLGLDMEVRILQFNNPLAEDIMFLVYQVTNASDKDINKAYFGMHGDPHVGGPDDYNDDNAGFIDPLGFSLQSTQAFPQRARNMVFAWDKDGKGMSSRPTGYFGWKFLESPSNSVDLKDNDDDGITDEKPDNTAGRYIDGRTIPLEFGISNLAKYTAIFGTPKPRFEGDEDGDWDPAKDDIGIDGIGPDSPNYPGPDFGEADGIPSQGWYLDANDNQKYDAGEILGSDRLPGYRWAGSEPSFGLRDISESDQIGLSSFHPAVYTNTLPNVPMNDPLMWEWLSSDTIDTGQELLKEAGDNIFNFGTGPLKLEKGESQRFSMCILFGNSLNDLVLNAETSTRILESDYRFAKPPDKPIVKAVPGDKRVTLYWDNTAEKSFDPFLRTFDFQGYKIYRSRDYTFSDVYTITDANGVPFLGQALSQDGIRAQFDKIDSLSGLHPIEYSGRGVKYNMGDNTGLVHQYVDTSVVNGITYYYAVVSYDAGSIQFTITPTESQAVIKRDPITSEFVFDVNTVQVTPGAVAAGMKNAEAGNLGIPERVHGNSTGDVYLQILDPLQVQENKNYEIAVIDDSTYNVTDLTGVSTKFTSKDTVSVNLGRENIKEGTVKLFDQNNALIDPSAYQVNARTGKIKGTSAGSLPQGQQFKAEFQYYPVYLSTRMDGSDGNPTFDGLKVFVENNPLQLDMETSGFSSTAINVNDMLFYPPKSGTPKHYRANWKITWNDLDTANGTWVHAGDTAKTQLKNNLVVCPFRILNVTENKPATYLIFEGNARTRGNKRWDWGEPIIFQPQGETGFVVSYQLGMDLPDSTVTSPVYPKSGDIYYINTLKPFQAGDLYTFTTKAAAVDVVNKDQVLDNIFVVPNPYVGFSEAEEPGRAIDKRGDRVLQFRNLPNQCTIRIYTITGELVQTLHKDDLTSMTSWDLLSYEGQRIAYGIYIYHVDAPGVGEKIGRFAVIK